MKKNLIFFTTLILFILTTTIPITSSNLKEISLSTTWAKVRLSVFDEQNQPIDMATICIIETNEYYTTQKLGQCEIKFIINKTSNIFKSSSWEEFTLLIYKNGYKPHILFGLKAIPNITKTGIVITLIDVNYNTENTYTQSYDYPNNTHALKILNEYKK